MKDKILLIILVVFFSGTAQTALIDRGGGMIYDDQLDITWLQDANYAVSSGYAEANAGGIEDSGSPSIIKTDGSMSWSSAVLWAENLDYSGYDDWRLPTNRESFSEPETVNEVFVAGGSDFLNRRSYQYVARDLQHELGFMYYMNLNRLPHIGIYSDNNGVTLQEVELCTVEVDHPRCSDNFFPFINVDRNRRYWSNDAYRPNLLNDTGAYYFWFGLGKLKADARGHTKYAWAVRSGDVSVIPDPNISLIDQLVAYYPFENNADDKSDYGNHGIVNGEASYVLGAIGNGLKLKGIHSMGGILNPDYIRVPNADSLQFSDQLTISYWVKIDGNQRHSNVDCSAKISEGIYGAVVGKSGDRKGLFLTETEYSSDFGINVYNGGHKQSVGGLKSVFEKFRFVTYSMTGNTVKLYVDGVLRSSQLGTVNFDSMNNEDLYIGVQTNNANNCLTQQWYPLDGVIDELRFYSRVLSDAEINALYKQRPNAEQCSDLDPVTCNSYRDVNLLLEWAGNEYPALFEKGRETFAIEGYWARFYPAMNLYLGSRNRKVYGYGALWNGLIYFGELDQFLSDQQLN